MCCGRSNEATLAPACALTHDPLVRTGIGTFAVGLCRGRVVVLVLQPARTTRPRLVRRCGEGRRAARKHPGWKGSLEPVHHGEDELDTQRFVEVWSPEGILLYRSPTLQGGTLGGPPRPRPEGSAEPSPFTVRLADGTRVRMAASIPSVDGRR